MANANVVAVPDTIEDLNLEDLSGEELLVAIQEQATDLVVPLYNHHSAKPIADLAKRSWNDSVLAIVGWALQAGVALNTVYDTISETLANKVAAVGREAKLGAEQLVTLRALVDNTVSQLNGPFYRMARIFEVETAVNLLAEIGRENDTIGKLKTFIATKIEDLAFHEDRGKIECSYTPKGSDKVVNFTVAQAAKTRQQYQDLVAKAKGVKDKNSRQWSAVSRKYRAEFPAGMVDARTKAERQKVFASVGERVMAQGSMTAEELAVFTQEPTK